MKWNIFLTVLIAVFLTSCEKDSSEKIKLLEGYWNIETVQMPDGSEKAFPFSNHMDYFEVNENTGMKHRVSPRYDGSFVNYGSPVPFKWKEKDGVLLLKFADSSSAYQQTLKCVSENELVLLHENGTLYTYTSYTPDAKQ